MGQKLAAYNASGTITAFYDSVDSPAPSDASTIEITDTEWRACLATPGYTVQQGVLVAPAAPTAAQQLATAKTAQLALLEASCATTITNGFTSSALGSPYAYPSGVTDQANLTACVGASQLPVNASDANWTVPFMCADANGVWVRRPHTAAQIQQVGLEGMTHIVGLLEKKDGLEASVNGASTVAEVQAVTWA